MSSSHLHPGGGFRHLPLHLIAIVIESILIHPSHPQPSSSSSIGHSSSNKHASIFRIVEELPPGTIVGNVKQNRELVTSLTRSSLSQLQFSFRHSGSSHHQFFFIDQSTGVLKTTRKLDRETVCSGQTQCSLSFDVIVSPTQFFRIIPVVVEIDDINDNAPYFPVEKFHLEINENLPSGTRFPLPGAVDADSSTNGIQAYLAIHQDTESEAKFGLNTTDQDDGSKTLSLVLRHRLDRESRDSYVITVVASDGGSPPKTASLDVTVAVSDANDNSPVFDDVSYDVSLSERRIPDRIPIGRVHATDMDADRNADIRYGLAEFSEASYGKMFSVDPLSGDIFLQNSLDFERQRSYVLVVVASDLGARSLSSFVKVNVLVQDENDCPPSITLNPLSVTGIVSIPENSDPGTPVAQLVVGDGDSGRNAEVHCSVFEEQWFHLDEVRESEYRLVASTTFDREKESHNVITVTCSDRGEPPLTVSKAVDIEVLDENDNAPVLFHGDPVIIQVDENNLPGSSIGQVDASDKDSGLNSEIRFNLTTDDPRSASLLTLNPITGQIQVNEVLDYEHQSDYTFQLKVFDLGDPIQSTVASLVLRVRDTNDEVPHFEKPAYYFFVVENLAVGSPIGITKATDMDRSVRFSQITYRFVDTSLPFHIDPDTGQLTVARKLDREETQTFRFVVIGQNQEPFGHVRSIVNVTVYVDDVNDNEPIVRFPTKNRNVAFVANNARNGSLVARVDAWDPDEGSNSKLSYSISHGNDEDMFQIDDETGAITVVNPRQHIRDSYNLVVTVRDAGTPALFSVVDLLVKVNRSGSDTDQGHSFSGLDGARMSDRLIIIVGMIAAFFVILFVIGLILLLSLLRRRSRRRDKKVMSVLDLGSLGAEGEGRGSALDSEMDKYSGRYSAKVERCSNKDCPFAIRDGSPIPVHLQTGSERKRREDGDDGSETRAQDNTEHNKKLHDDAITRLSCDEVVRSRAMPARRPLRMLHDAKHVVPTSKSCDFLGSAAVRLCQFQDHIEMQQMGMKPGLPRDSYEYSDCSDSCIDSGLDPNEDFGHTTFAVMTESCTSYLPVN